MVECSVTRVLTVVVVACAIVVTVLAAVLIWREQSRPEDTDSSYTSTVAKQHYPGFFRTQDEQQLWADRYLDGFHANRTIVNETFKFQNASEFCGFFGCQKRKKRESERRYLYHGCCKSSVMFISPEQHRNLGGDVRTLVHFDDRRQYFVLHECKMDSGCGGCTCSQEHTLYTAVVVKSGVTAPDDIEDTEIDFFYINGCCKCVNT